jgi:hypothetical protein
VDKSVGIDDRSNRIRSIVVGAARLSLVVGIAGSILTKRRKICDDILFERVIVDDVELE